MKICPLFGNIVVEEIRETEQKTDSGLYIPETSQDKSQQKIGKILAVGEGEYIPVVASINEETKEAVIARIPMNVKEGDTIVFKNWGATPVTLGGKTSLVLNQKDVLAIVEK